MQELRPRLITLPKIGQCETGFISLLENENLPFIPKRIYWTYNIPKTLDRGKHAHKLNEQVIIVVSGSILFNLETIYGEKISFTLNSPNTGLFIPKMTWRDLIFQKDAILVCIASEVYLEGDYIRSYKEFLEMQSKFQS